MKFDMKQFNTLSNEELYLVYCVLVTYSDMPAFDPNTFGLKNNSKRNKTKKQKIKHSNIPNLFDFDDPEWNNCEIEVLLIYRYIMEKTLI